MAGETKGTSKKKTTTTTSSTSKGKTSSSSSSKTTNKTTEAKESALPSILEKVDLDTQLAFEKAEEYLKIADEYKDVTDGSQYKRAMFKYCYLHNIPFISMVYDESTQGRDSELVKYLPFLYLETIKEDVRYKDLTFFEQIKFESFDTVYSQEVVNSELTEDARRDRQQILSIVGYDPFDKFPIEDKPQLYRDLTGMLTDNMRKDIPKAKAAIEVVTGYNNIRKYQDRVNSLINSGRLDEDTQKQLDSHLQMITKIQTSVTATSEKNGFSNSKSLGSNGRGMLSDVMKTIDEHIYDPGITNFYDIATSNSFKEVNDLSCKSLFNQIKLTGQEYADILIEQNKMVHECQSKLKQSQEALRIAKSLITKDKLIQQLQEEYRQKGISEKDIDEFISREYQLWNGR